MTELNLTPGAIVTTKYDKRKFLLVSMPTVIRTLKQVKAVPIAESIKELKCTKLPHIIVPTNLITRGIICLHQEHTLYLADTHFVERINDELLTYVMSQV